MRGWEEPECIVERLEITAPSVRKTLTGFWHLMRQDGEAGELNAVIFPLCPISRNSSYGRRLIQWRLMRTG